MATRKNSTLNEDDIKLRKTIVINEGNLSKTSEDLGWNYWRVVNKLRAKKNRLWWLSKKAHFVRMRKRARERNWYKRAKLRRTQREIARSGSGDGSWIRFGLGETDHNPAQDPAWSRSRRNPSDLISWRPDATTGGSASFCFFPTRAACDLVGYR